MGLPLEEYGSTLRNFVRIYKDPQPKNSIFFHFTPKEILNFYNLPLKNSIGPQRGDTDINATTFSLKETCIARDPGQETSPEYQNLSDTRSSQ